MKGPKLATMAWRNLWRNRRRTLITLSAVVFGTFLAVLFTGMGDSTYGDMINLAARMGGGHVSLQHRDYLEMPALKRTVKKTKEKSKLALKDPDVKGTATRIMGHTMLAAGGNSFGAGFIAFDPTAEDTNTLALLESISEGKVFASARNRGIVLGTKLASNLGVKLGRKVVYTLTDKQGEIVTGLARVSGIIKTGAPSADSAMCLLPLGTVRDALGYSDDEATHIALYIGDQRRSQAVADRIGPQLAGSESARVWSEVMPELAGFIGMKVSGTIFFEFLIAILVAAGIFNTLFVSVMERVREFGIMLAIGYSPGHIFRLVMWESLWVALCGLVLAGLVTAWPYHYLSTTGIDFSGMVGDGGQEVAGVAMKPQIFVRIYVENALIIAGAVLAATLGAGLYPAWKAGRVAPVDSIKLV